MRVEPSHPRRRRGPRSLLAAVAAVSIALSTGLLAAPVSLAVDQTPTGNGSATIASGVHVGSIDLSGLDETGARQLLQTAFAGIGQGEVAVSADGAAVGTISYSSIYRHVDIDALILQAFEVGRDGSVLDQLRQFVTTITGGFDLQPTVTFDEVGLAQQITDIAFRSSRKMVNAFPVRTATGFSTIQAQVGRTFDPSPVIPPLISQLHDVNAPLQIPVSLPGIDVQPRITDIAAQMARASAAAISVPIVLANGGQKWTIPEEVVRSWIYFKSASGIISILVNDALVQKSLATIVPQINREPVSAAWEFTPSGVKVTPGVNGRTVDIPRTARRLEVFLQGRLDGTVTPAQLIGPTVASIPPTFSTAQAQAASSRFQLLSTWTTYFDPGPHNGDGANIWVPAGYLDNQVVGPGQSFSFWDRVGEVSLERGYKLGGAIVQGHTEENVAIGGGICATSTTLFNAVVRAGYQAGERSNHFYYITRYPVGLDATVSISSGGGVQDLKWTNDTAYPVLIKSFRTARSVTFSLYGIPTGRSVSFSKPIIKNYKPATNETVAVSTLPTGKQVRIEYPDDGFDAWVTRTVRDASGGIVHQETFYSHYSMIKGVVYVGDPNGKPLVVPPYAPGIVFGT
jgi:vancomycin resistance protein YoaR